MTSPQTHYARTDDGAHIAYQIVGDGPRDLIFIPWWWNHLEGQWDDPLIAHFLERLAGFSRLILFDMRGVGLSDPASLTEPPTLERWMDDARAVLDDVGTSEAIVLGHGDGGLVAQLLAATHPGRVAGLVLVDSYARLGSDSGYQGLDPDELDGVMSSFFGDFWGTGDQRWVHLVAPSQSDNEAFRSQLARLERLSVSPGAAVAIQRVIGHLDTRAVLSSISAPTLVVVHRDDCFVPPHYGRYLAQHIHLAELIELEGGDHLYWVGNPDATLDRIERFVTGTAAVGRVERILATVLFTDSAGSTERAVALGDARWTALLEQHHALVRRQLERFRGNEVKTMGDGFLATFDGPARAIACACAIRDGVSQLGLAVRAGVHTGEIEITPSDVAGIAVHIGQRVSSLAHAGEVMVSRTVVDLVVGSGIAFSDRGEHELRGVPGRWRVYTVDA